MNSEKLSIIYTDIKKERSYDDSLCLILKCEAFASTVIVVSFFQHHNYRNNDQFIIFYNYNSIYLDTGVIFNKTH